MVELNIELYDSKNQTSQELATLGTNYILKDGQFLLKDRSITLKVWANPEREDFTHEFLIQPYDFEDDMPELNP